MTLVKMMSDIPLPMPRWVISSPSHMINAVPAVIVMTMTRNVAVPSSCSNGYRALSQPWSRLPERASATVT